MANLAGVGKSKVGKEENHRNPKVAVSIWLRLFLAVPQFLPTLYFLTALLSVFLFFPCWLLNGEELGKARTGKGSRGRHIIKHAFYFMNF